MWSNKGDILFLKFIELTVTNQICHLDQMYERMLL